MLLGNIQQAVDAGFPRIKLKVGRGWDLEMLRVVRGAFPDTTFHIDCNSGYTLDDLPFFQAIDELGLAFIEQPLHYADVLDHAELAKRIQTPVCLDESIVSIKAAEQAISVGACEYINIKPGRVGGLANARAIHDLCQDAGIPVWIGGMLESALGGALCVEVATLPNFTYPGDLFPSSRFYTEDLSDPPMELTPRKTFQPFEGRLPTPRQEQAGEGDRPVQGDSLAKAYNSSNERSYGADKDQPAAGERRVALLPRRKQARQRSARGWRCAQAVGPEWTWG